jgi:hypothetical protein
MSNPKTQRDEDNLAAPPKLVAALKQVHPARVVFVPVTVDKAVLNAARRHLTKPQGVGFRAIRRWVWWPALGTACALAALVAHFVFKQANMSMLAREDLNRDGRVDILDAFQLARELQSGAKPAAGLDLNGDGVVDRRDAEVIAAQAVKLQKGGRS